MTSHDLLSTLRHALRAFDALDDDGWCEAFQRLMPLALDASPHAVWAPLPCATRPPTAWLLSTRTPDERSVHELWWCPDPDLPPDQWPVVEVDADGETAVVAATAEDWVDALLLTAGRMGGGLEDELEHAEEDASEEAGMLADALRDELDRELPSSLELAERWDEAQDQWADLWAEAIEALDD